MDEKDRELLKKKQLKRRRRRQIRAALFAFICILIVTVVSLVVIEFFFCADCICVVNASPYDLSDLMEQTGFCIGDPVFLLDKSPFEKIETDYPYVKSVDVNMSFPNNVTFVFSYAEPFLSFDVGGEYIIVDRDYKILERTTASPENICVISGFAFENATPGKILSEKDNIELSVLIDLVSQLEKEEWLGLTDSIDFSHIYNITFTVNKLLTVELGNSSDLDKKVEMAHYVASQNDSSRKARISVRNYSTPRYTLMD